VHTGGSLTFDARVSAPASNGAPVFLNGDSFNVTAPITLFALGGGLDGAILLGGGEVSVEGQHDETGVAGDDFALADGATNLGDAGKEGEDVAGVGSECNTSTALRTRAGKGSSE
jgi:hypothetical protein